MNYKITLGILVLSIVALMFTSCEKENELAGVTLYNPYDSASGIELMAIDSIHRNYGTLPNLKGYFHLDLNYVDTAAINRVIVYRNGIEKFRLSPGNLSNFVDITAIPGTSYDYQLSLIMKDSSYTKITISYLFLF